jgi:heme-degrading monooxygenase HmoA
MTVKENQMYARRVSLHLKPNSVSEFTQKLEKDVIPMLRKQKGFQDEITFVTPTGKEAFGVSLWDNKENAEAYSRGSYVEVTQILAKLVEGTPQVDTYEVSNSTFHKIGAAATN